MLHARQLWIISVKKNVPANGRAGQKFHRLIMSDPKIQSLQAPSNSANRGTLSQTSNTNNTNRAIIYRRIQNADGTTTLVPSYQ